MAMRAGMLSFEELAKKSKKALKRKVSLSAQVDGARYSNEDEGVPNVTGITEDQSVPNIRSKKRKKTHQDVREEKEENVQREDSAKKKRVKFNLESNTVNSGGQNKGIMVANENGAAEECVSNRGDTSWVQKASWKALVGETGRVAFSLGSMLGLNDSILPSGNGKLSVANMKQPQSSNNVSAWIDGTSTSPSLKQPSMEVLHSSNNVSAWIDGTSSSPPLKPPHQPYYAHSDSTHVKKTSNALKNFKHGDSFGPRFGASNGAQGGLRENTEHENAKRPDCLQNYHHHHNGVDEGCTFMRSENYEQEWLEAKRAVKEIFKRSRKDALRSIKMFHTRHNT